MTVAYFQRVFYCALSCLSGRRLVHAEAEAWNHDSVLELGEGLDCSLHTGLEVFGSHFNLNPQILHESIRENPLLRRGVLWEGFRDSFFGTCFCLGCIPALS